MAIEGEILGVGRGEKGSLEEDKGILGERNFLQRSLMASFTNVPPLR